MSALRQLGSWALVGAAVLAVACLVGYLIDLAATIVEYHTS